MSRKKTITVLLVLILLLAYFPISNYFSHRGLIKVQVRAIPNDSLIFIDGKPGKNGTNYLTPGDHKIKATRQFFTDTEKSISTNDLNKKDVVYLFPGADSSEAIQFLKDNPKIQLARESAADLESKRQTDLIISKNPIVKFLPKENSHYRVDYTFDESEKIKLSIALYGIYNGPEDSKSYQSQLKQYKVEALAFINNYGLNPSNTDITFSPPVK